VQSPRKIVWKRIPTDAPKKRPGRLTPEEQENVRRAIYSLRRRYGTLPRVASVLGLSIKSLERILNPRGRVSAAVALEAARVAGVTVDEVLRGSFPGGLRVPHVRWRRRDE